MEKETNKSLDAFAARWRNFWSHWAERPVFRGWVVSYLLILAIPLALCLIIFWLSNRTIRAESTRMYNSQLEQVRIDLDSYWEEIQQALDQVVLSAAVQKTTHIGTVVEPEDQLTLVDVVTELNHVQLSHAHLDDVFLVLNQPGGVVGTTGYMSEQMFYDIYLKSDQTSYEEFREYMSRSYTRWDMTSIQKSDGEQYLMFVRTTLSNNYSYPSATAVVIIRQQTLQERLEQFQWDARLNLYVVTPENEVICHTSSADTFTLPFSQLGETTAFTPVINDGIRVQMLTRAAHGPNWSYVLLVTNGLLSQSARWVQLYTFLGFVVCMAMGLMLSVRLARHNYGPLDRVIGKFGAQQALPPQSTNEYERLDGYVQTFLQKQIDDQHELFNSRQTLRKYYLFTVLERPYDPEKTGDADARYQVSLDAACYQTLLFSIPLLPGAGAGFDTQNHSFELLQYGILNIFTEIAGQHFPLETTDIGETAAVIVGLPDDEAETQSRLEQDIRFTQQKVQEIFHQSVAAALGAVHQGRRGIHYSYLEALDAVSYLAEEEIDLVYYSDIADAGALALLPPEQESNLIDLVAAGHAEQSKAIINQLFSGRQRTAATTRCLAFDVAAALVKGANQGRVQEVSDIHFAEIEHASPNQLPGKLCQSVDALCEKIRSVQIKATPAAQLCSEMRSYIADNYRDPDLNISQLGLHFNMTPAYLSNLFKKETGVNLLVYLNMVRLDAAKELLGQPLPLAQIAEKTGFRDSGALIRVFKKHTGLTPGQYRTVHLGHGTALTEK